MSKVNVRDYSRVSDLLKEIRKLDCEIKVGVYSNEPEIIIRANVNEYGSEIIPERSFIRGTFDEEINKMNIMAQRAVDNVINGADADDQIEDIAEYLVRAVKEKIQNIGPPNAPETVEIKQGNDPLVDTGDLLDSIDYEVVR